MPDDSYFRPNAEVLFCSGVGLTPEYVHTYRFRTRKEQRDFFESKSPYRNSQMTYQRVDSNTIRVDIAPGLLYLCDYMMINEHRGDMPDDDQFWFYCFITSVEYKNENCTYVHYQVDWLQTFFVEFFTNLNQCFVIRQHSVNDELTTNTIPDNIDIGDEYAMHDQRWTNIKSQFTMDSDEDGTFHNWLPIIVYPNEQPEININSRVPQLLTYAVCTDKAFMRRLIDDMPGDQQAEIVDMFMYPEKLLPEGNHGTEKVITEKCPIPGRKGYNPWDKQWSSLSSSYVPKNNKAYTYPYCYIMVTNNIGQKAIYKPERYGLDVEEALFEITGSFGINPEFLCNTRGFYCQINNRTNMNGLSLTGSPKIGWFTDAYKVYTAQNAASIRVGNITAATQALGGVIDIVRGAVLAPVESAVSVAKGETDGVLDTTSIQAGISKVENALGWLAKQQDAKNLADTTHTANAPSVLYLRGYFGFDCYVCRCPLQMIRIADAFWTMYGYPINRMMKPNITSRPHFNYLKATNVTSNAKISSVALTVIQRVLAQGITFWDRESKIGDYSVDNGVQR